jgi:hypothetical protein
MESSRDDRFAATVSSLRPAPHPEFVADLDERAAAGFPRRSGQGDSPLSRLFARLRATSPRRALLPAGAVALTAIVVATAVVATTESGPAELANNSNASQEPPAPRSTQASESGKATALNAFPSKAASSGSNGAGSAAESSAGTGRETEVPAYETEVPRLAGSAANGRSESSNSSGTAKSGPYASHANHRAVERSAEMVLGAEPSEVSEDAAKVFETVHAYHGIVLNSSTSNGSAGDAGARFDVLIPSGKLGDALAAFSGIAEVVSRHEATNDITAPTIGLSERLQDSNAKIDGLLNELAGSETETERAAIEAELRSERSRAGGLKARLTNLQRRATFSRVSLRIETSSSSSASGGGWDIGDALHDAGRILAIAAGVTIVGLAILAPLALIALLVWLANRTRVRRGRERALG